MTVRDDGPGMPEAGGTGEGGLGLSNVRARLARRYGEEHELRLSNHPQGGLEVTLTIPFETDGFPGERAERREAAERASLPLATGDGA